MLFHLNFEVKLAVGFSMQRLCSYKAVKFVNYFDVNVIISLKGDWLIFCSGRENEKEKYFVLHASTLMLSH